MMTVTSLIKTETLKLVYFTYIHSIMSYRIIFWGNSTDRKKEFNIKKSLEKWQALKGEPHVGKYSRNLIFFH
jgi:hypothetical protein